MRELNEYKTMSYALHIHEGVKFRFNDAAESGRSDKLRVDFKG